MKKKTTTRKTASKTKISNQTEAVDQSLTRLPKSLIEKLQVLNSQMQVGDLRSLGLRVLDRAKAISNQIKDLPKKVKAKSQKSAKPKVAALKKKVKKKK